MSKILDIFFIYVIISTQEKEVMHLIICIDNRDAFFALYGGLRSYGNKFTYTISKRSCSSTL